MQPIFVDVAPVMIDWVMKSVSGTLDERVTDNLLKWRNGDKKPTFNQVESVSKATQIPLGYFFLQAPPEEIFPVLEYRTINGLNTDTPSRNLIDTINKMENVQEWMRNYMIESDSDRLAIVGAGEGVSNPQTIANSIRKVLDIKPEWYKSVRNMADAFTFFRRKLENAGVLVMLNGIVGNNTHRVLDINEFRAFTLIDEYAPLIFINSNDSQSAKLFSLLHELAHVWLGLDNFYNDRHGNANGIDSVEVICNAVASEILIPNTLFRAEWQSAKNQDVLLKISETQSVFKCGIVVIARKALDNQYINKAQYQTIVDEAIEQFRASRKKASGGNYYATAASRIDNRFLMALDSSVREGKTQYSDAFHITNTNRTTFLNLMEAVRGAG